MERGTDQARGGDPGPGSTGGGGPTGGGGGADAGTSTGAATGGRVRDALANAAAGAIVWTADRFSGSGTGGVVPDGGGADNRSRANPFAGQSDAADVGRAIHSCAIRS